MQRRKGLHWSFHWYFVGHKWTCTRESYVMLDFNIVPRDVVLSTCICDTIRHIRRASPSQRCMRSDCRVKRWLRLRSLALASELSDLGWHYYSKIECGRSLQYGYTWREHNTPSLVLTIDTTPNINQWTLSYQYVKVKEPYHKTRYLLSLLFSFTLKVFYYLKSFRSDLRMAR